MNQSRVLPGGTTKGREAGCPCLVQPARVIPGEQAPVSRLRGAPIVTAPTANEGAVSKRHLFRGPPQASLFQALLASAHLLDDLGQDADFVSACFLPVQNEGARTPLGRRGQWDICQEFGVAQMKGSGNRHGSSSSGVWIRKSL